MKSFGWMKVGVLGAGLLGAGLLSSASVQAAGDVAAGKVKAEPCLGCHGIPGYANAYPTYSVPKLAGQESDYLVAALQAYASGMRHHKTMQAQAATLSQQDMEDIAAFFTAAHSSNSE